LYKKLKKADKQPAKKITAHRRIYGVCCFDWTMGLLLKISRIGLKKSQLFMSRAAHLQENL
jgi:hypothetical protein